MNVASTSLVVKLTGLLNAHVMMVGKVKMEPSALTSMNVLLAITIVTQNGPLVSTSITHSNANVILDSLVMVSIALMLTSVE